MDLLNYAELIPQLSARNLQMLARQLDDICARGFSVERFGDIPRWRAALEALPSFKPASMELDASVVTVGRYDDVSAAQRQALEAALRSLHPWRKGPFSIAGVEIDTEWRSDLKWSRLENAIEPLQGRIVLDVGCGSGYHCWRMAGAGAELVLGIEPTPLFVMQYWALQRYISDPRTWVLPMRMEDLPAKLAAFDTVFSMGILYHRRSPMDHLLELRDTLKPGGQLVLETLVIEGGDADILVPEGRYAKMGNVWFIPSVALLCSWLRKLRFRDVSIVDVSATTKVEQRSTEWMTFQSLPDFLDPNDCNKTVEGYAAPRRAIVTAIAPA